MSLSLEKFGAVVAAPGGAGADDAAGEKQKDVEDEEEIAEGVAADLLQIASFRGLAVEAAADRRRWSSRIARRVGGGFSSSP